MPSHILLQPWSATSDDPFDRIKAAHLLNRAGFGGTPDEIARVMALGPIKAVDYLLDFKDQSAQEQGHDLPDTSKIPYYGKTVREVVKELAGKTDDQQKEIRKMVMEANREALRVTIAWWLKRMAYGPNPLQEKLTLFWHGHFVTSDKDERSASSMWNQNELLRKFVLGNFRTFLQKISRDPAMLDYLNNTQNRKAHPNENYARELMELFTMGIGNYTEDDVKQGARAFTGWAHDGDDYVFRKFDHDEGVKTFLGHAGNFNGDDVIDIILAQKVTAKFISNKLFRFFAYEEIDDHLAEALGDEFRRAKFELRPLVKMILTSRAFYSPVAVGSQIKSPIQLVLGTIRQMGMTLPDDRLLMASLNQMGQVPFAPPNVRGWSGGRMWINTSTLFVRYNVGVRLLGGDRRSGTAVLVEDPKSPDPSATVDYWVNRLIQRPISPEKTKVLLAALGENSNPDKLRQMIQLIVSMPEYQLC